MEASLLRHTLSQICQASWKPLTAQLKSVNRQYPADTHGSKGMHVHEYTRTVNCRFKYTVWENKGYMYHSCF